MVDPRKLMKLVATKNKQFGHTTPQQEIFLDTLHGDRRLGPKTRKERRIARAKAREEMFNEKSAYTDLADKITEEVLSALITKKEANGA